MDERRAGFWPSDQALLFGERYAELLARWATLFTAASELVAANVALGRAASESAKEFDEWLRMLSASPWNWMRPEAFAQFAEIFKPPTGKPPSVSKK